MTVTPIGGLVQNGKNMVDKNQYLKRYSVSQSLDMPASRQELWQIISREGNLEDCHPFCKANTPVTWNDQERTDQLVYLNGLTYLREFLVWQENNGYELIIGNKAHNQSFVIWKIDEITEYKSRLTITVYPYLFSNWWRLPYYLIFKLYVKPRLTNYLKSVVKGFSYYIETNQSVPKNHFGRHSWFS